jgi:GGDEF domain-containing protein
LHTSVAPRPAEPDAIPIVAEVPREDLDGTLGRRAGREQIQCELERARRQGLPLTIVFFDVGGSGEELLTAAATALRRGLRSYDLVVRWDADEFVCAIPGRSSTAAAQRVGRIAASVTKDFPDAAVSPGHAQLEEGDTMEEVVHRARQDSSRRRAQAQAPETAPAGSPHDALAGTVASVSCFGCGGRLPLSDFVLDGLATRRYADCGDCGATTVIHLDAGSGG